MPVGAFALSPEEGAQAPQCEGCEEKVEQSVEDRFVIDKSATSGNFNSSTFFVGSSVNDKSTVNGANFVAADNATLNGDYEYGFHVGDNLVLGGKYEKDIFAAGNNMTIAKESIIGRDIYFAGNELRIYSNISGSVFAAGDTIRIDNVTISGDLKVAADKIIFGQNVQINGYFDHNDTLKITGTATYKEERIYVVPQVNTTMASVMSFSGSVIISIVFILLGARFFEKVKERSETYNYQKFASDLLAGVIAMVAVPVVIILLLMSVIGIPAALLLLVVFIVVYLLAGTVTAEMIGRKVFRIENIYVGTSLGLLVLFLISFIPGINAVSGMISGLYGLGLIVKVFLKK